MNHSIYSADRTTHLKIVVVALVAGIVVAGFGISARTTSDEGYTQTASVMKAGKPVAITSSGNRWFANKGIQEFTRLFTSPPKSPRGYVEDPNYPQVDYGKRPLPTGVFFLWTLSILEVRAEALARSARRKRERPRAGSGARSRSACR